MLNTAIDIIYRKPETNTLYLKNKFYGTLLQISEPEYDIIRYYADHPDIDIVCAHYADEYALTPLTDGYFLCSDFWKTPDLYHEYQVQTKLLWQNLKQRQWTNVTRYSGLSCLYILLSVVSIFLYYGLLTLLIIAPAWVQLIY